MTHASVNPYAPPVAHTSGPAGQVSLDYFREGQDLVVRRESTLPDICIATGEPSGARATKKLSWIPPWTIVVFLLSRLIGLICMLVARKTAHLTFTLSEPAKAKRKRGLAIGLAVFGLGFVALIGAIVMDGDRGSVALVGMGGLAVLVGIILAAVLHRPYQLRKMDDDYMYLRLKPEAIDAFEAYRTAHAPSAHAGPSYSPFASHSPLG